MAATAGCHTPSGGVMPFTGGSSTYYSTPDRPTTVTLVDTRTGEAFFSIEIPVGKQLSLDFVEGGGDDPVTTPDLMRYQIFELGTSYGKLRDALTVPAASCRRIDVDFRLAPEQAPPPPDRELSTDSFLNRPAWWTPQGGPLPRDAAMTMYDD
jgi:hypothetical protein